MKKLWKALGITALAAALLPYRVRKDPESDTTTVDALLWQAARRPGQGEDKGQVDISLGFKSPFQEVREERELFTDDPEEAVLFADIEPAAGAEAKADAPAPVEEDAPSAEEPAEPEATEEDFDPEL